MQTPVRKQYLQLKKLYPDAILFFQLGDFYETFESDAETVARVCEITLTSREMGMGQRLPLAGVPVHAAEGYIAKLIHAGYRVAICQQMERNARPSFTQIVSGESGGPRVPITREVTRVVTPGTVVEPGLLEEKSNNYLAALVVDGRRAGLAYADITTGEFACTQVGPAIDDLWQMLAAELGRLKPAECLVPAGDRGGGHATAPPRPGRMKAHVGAPSPTAADSAGWQAKASGDQQSLALAGRLAGFPLTAWDDRHFAVESCREALHEHFGVTSLEGFGCAGMPLAIRAAGALVRYLHETQRAALQQLTGLRTYNLDSFMVLDLATRRNLELEQTSRGGTAKGSLLSVLDRTATPMGGRLLRKWLSQPLLDLPRLATRQQAIAELVADTMLRARLVDLLKHAGDVERAMNRVAQGIASPREVRGLNAGLETVLAIKSALAESLTAEGLLPGADFQRRARREQEEGGGKGNDGEAEEASRLAWLWARLDECPEVRSLIEQSIVADPPASFAEGGIIAPGFSAELDALKEGSKDARQFVAGLEGAERERTGVKSLKVGYNKVFGYYIEVTHAALRQELSEPQLAAAAAMVVKNPALAGRPRPQIAREYLEQYCGYLRKQTLVGAERFITPELKEKEALILSAQERMAELEERVFREVCHQIAAARGRLMLTAGALAHLDVFVALAEVAVRHSYVRPALNDGHELHIAGGRHPVVEQALSDTSFIPNDCYLSNAEQQLIILTGPNMAGKSTYLRQVAIIVLMAQIGSYVPAQAATIGLVDRVFTRVGAQDDIATGQSTFMVEMAETANILSHATSRSLVILDEIGRGTSTFDGMAIARAVIEYMHNHPRLGCKTLFATHYHELTALEGLLPRVKNYRMDVLEEGAQVVFLHQVVRGGADRSYGIYVARLAGIPKAVTRRAEELLRELEEGRDGRREAARRPSLPDGVLQLGLFAEPHPAVEELSSLDVDSLTPLEAIAKLYELRQKAREQAD